MLESDFAGGSNEEMGKRLKFEKRAAALKDREL